MITTLNRLYCTITLSLALGAAPAVSAADVHVMPGASGDPNGGYYSSPVRAENIQPAADLAAAPAADAAQPADISTPYAGTLYRNGGKFGPQNSDDALEVAP